MNGAIPMAWYETFFDESYSSVSRLELTMQRTLLREFIG